MVVGRCSFRVRVTDNYNYNSYKAVKCTPHIYSSVTYKIDLRSWYDIYIYDYTILVYTGSAGEIWQDIYPKNQLSRSDDSHCILKSVIRWDNTFLHSINWRKMLSQSAAV